MPAGSLLNALRYDVGQNCFIHSIRCDIVACSRNFRTDFILLMSPGVIALDFMAISPFSLSPMTMNRPYWDFFFIVYLIQSNLIYVSKYNGVTG